MTTPNIPANDPSLRSWIDVPADSDFPIQNLPFGIGERKEAFSRVMSRIGDQAIDLFELLERGLLDKNEWGEEDFLSGSLNLLLSHGPRAVRDLRTRLSMLLRYDGGELPRHMDDVMEAMFPVDLVNMDVPVAAGNYTDFYSSRQHAFNVGSMFRDPANALLPNWLHMPIAYHGRASSIVATGKGIHRPCGQFRPDPNAPPVFGPTRQLDFELEVGFITFYGRPLGEPIPIAEAEDHIFGLVLFNDWSARDIQAWEYVPLGPFLGKNFASSMSPWIVTLDALEPFRVAGPKQDPPVLPYLRCEGDRHFNIDLEVGIVPSGGKETTVCRGNFKDLYWSMAQQLAHHTVNGCNVVEGDLMASGTISGEAPGSYGSMLELAWKGTRPLKLSDGSERSFILDGDTVVMRGHARRGGIRVGFGELRTEVLPAPGR